MSNHERDGSGHHVVPVPVYLGIFAALLVLTGLTVWVAFLDFGEWSFLHTPAALAIAAAKATLVVLWFMHVKYSPRLTWVFISAGLLWLVILIAITVADYVGRGWEHQGEGWQTTAAVVRPAPEDMA